MSLTDELVYSLAPDSKATDLARALADSSAFADLRRSPDGAWLSASCGTYAVRIDLTEGDKVHTSCTCASYKRPCKHALGLLFFAVRQPDRFAAEVPSAKARAGVLAQAQAGRGSVSVPKPTGPPANPTSVGEALFQNICAEPLDDAPRLIYADWLDEQGEADRAEFIRAQCQLARASASDDQAPALLQRQKALFVKNRTAWLRDVPPGLRKSHTVFERGFLSRLQMPASALLKHGAELFRHHPIHHVKVTGLLSTADAAKLAVCPFLARVRVLDLSNCLLQAPNVLKALLATPFLSGLIELSLVANELGARGMKVLAPSWHHLAGLERLDLSWNVLYVAGVSAFWAAPHFQRLGRLHLGSNWLDDRGAVAVAKATPFPSLTELLLPDNEIGPRGAKALAASPLLKQLTLFDLRFNVIGDAGARALIASPFLGPSTRVLLAHNYITAPTVTVIRERFGPGAYPS